MINNQQTDLQNTPPILDLEKVKKHLRVDYDCEDDLLRGYIGAAQSFVENYLNKTLLVNEHTITVNLATLKKVEKQTSLMGGTRIVRQVRLPHAPLREILTVEINDEVAALQDWFTESGSHGYLYIHSLEPGTARVAYQGGLALTPDLLPEAIKHACLIVVTDFYLNREGTTSKNDLVFKIANLLAPYRHFEIV